MCVSDLLEDTEKSFILSVTIELHLCFVYILSLLEAEFAPKSIFKYFGVISGNLDKAFSKLLMQLKGEERDRAKLNPKED